MIKRPKPTRLRLLIGPITAVAISSFLACAIDDLAESRLDDLDRALSQDDASFLSPEVAAEPVNPLPAYAKECPADSGCTCIEWCNAPADASEYGIDWGVVCRVDRTCNKYSSAVKADCLADLQSVSCAHNLPAVIVYEDEKF